jgi:hypothetical protein
LYILQVRDALAEDSKIVVFVDFEVGGEKSDVFLSEALSRARSSSWGAGATVRLKVGAEPALFDSLPIEKRWGCLGLE